MPRCDAKRNRAFTLIELLVVVAIIAVLLSLLLPAVQHVRESANCVSCTNNLRQIGEALQNYASANEVLPPGYYSSLPYVDGATDTSPGWSWATYILPYLEQNSLYGQLNLDASPTSNPNIQNAVQIFLCPSDLVTPAPFNVPDAFGDTVAAAAPSSYAACCGGDESDTAAPTGLGIFYRNSQTRLSDVTDGTSETIMVGDRCFASARGIWAAALDDAVCTRGLFDPTSLNPGMSTFPAPCLVLAHSHLNNPDGDSDSSLDDFSSRHPGGSNFLFADGSVHFLRSVLHNNPDGSYPLDSLTLQALGTRANNEIIPGNWID